MVSSSFILVPTLESTQILSSKPKLESSESGSPGETAAVIKEEDGKYTERFVLKFQVIFASVFSTVFIRKWLTSLCTEKLSTFSDRP